jgi:hypothetical protein
MLVTRPWGFTVKVVVWFRGLVRAVMLPRESRVIWVTWFKGVVMRVSRL